MSKHFVGLGGVWVNARQVCYVRDNWNGDQRDGALVGFHGGCANESYHGDVQTNELFVGMQTAAVVAKLEKALQEGGAE